MEISASNGRTKQLLHRLSIATIDAIEHVLNVPNSYMAYKEPSMSLHRVIITTRRTFAFDACFVWKLAPLADERSGFFIENLSQEYEKADANSYLALWL
jgi:hypothetical protein